VQSQTHYLSSDNCREHRQSSIGREIAPGHISIVPAGVLTYIAYNMIRATRRPSVMERGDSRLKACLLLLLVTVLPGPAMGNPVNDRPIIGNVQIT
jgi:hypothetical protein